MHYANGRPAKVGDHVVGRVYNTPGIIAGTLVSLTPGADSCSAQVESHVVVPKDQADLGEKPRMLAENSGAPGLRIDRGSEQHGATGAKVAVFRCRDYSHAGNLLHVDDAGGGLLKELTDAKVELTNKGYEIQRLTTAVESYRVELGQAREDLETIAKQHAAQAPAPTPAADPALVPSAGHAQ